MTDRHSGYVVTLENDIRDDDAADTIKALSMVRGVLSVTPIVAGIDQHIADARAWSNLRSKVIGFVLEQKPK